MPFLGRTASCFLVSILAFHFLLTVSAQMMSLAMRPHGVSEEYLLLRYLLTNYSKVARPVARSNDAVLVLARLFPIKLLNMYEKNEVLEMTMRLQLTWRDRMLVWHAPDFNNQSTVVIPGGQLWIPDLQIVNSVSDLYALLRDQKFDFKVHNDGSVWWHPTGNLVTRCELHLMYFPFDFRTDRAPVSLSMYAESGHWDLLKVTGQPRVLWVTNSTAFTRVEFWLYLGRKTTYFKMNIIFPCCMLSGLQMLTFFFPLESTERVPEATSILLSVIVFQTMIVDQLPRSSNSIPLLCIYVDMLTGISVLAVAEAVIVASLVSRKGLRTKAPKWTHSFLKFIYKWNSETNRKCGGASRPRSSLAFIRNSFAFQNLFGNSGANGTGNNFASSFTSSFRRKTRRPSNSRANKLSSSGIVLDNIHAGNLTTTTNTGPSLGQDNSNDTSPYVFRKPSGPSAGNRVRLQAMQSAPTTLPPNGMLNTTTVKFLPCSGGLDLIGEDANNEGGQLSNTSSMNNLTRRSAGGGKNSQQVQQMINVPFDAPLADFDPDSSLMMTSSLFGSVCQSSGVQSSALPPSILAPLQLHSSTHTGQSSNAETPYGEPPPLIIQSPPPELFVDDTNSVDDSWHVSTLAPPNIGNKAVIDQQMVSMSSASCSKPALPSQQQGTSAANRTSAELSPLLAPRKLPEREYNLASSKMMDVSSSPSPNVAAHRHAMAAIAAAAASSQAPHRNRMESYASTEGGHGDSQADLTNLPAWPPLPGLPRQPCMRRSRPSLFIPASVPSKNNQKVATAAADSDDIILDWIYLARVLDAFMFLICLTVVIVVPVVLFGVMPPTTVD